MGGRLIEANDVAALGMLSGRPHAIGPFVNVYNEATLAHLVRDGATRVCLPPELPLASVKVLAANAGGAAIEVFAFGRMPLAISARCYHARMKGLSRDSCQFVCAEDRDGRVATTLDGEDFLAVNGVQTLSYSYDNDIAAIPDLVATGVSGLRVARIFRRALDGALGIAEADAALRRLMPDATFSNGFLYGVEGAKLARA
jgi:collagenase-like PrtC family protease